MKKINPNYNEGMWKGAPASSFLKAQSLRRNEIAEEKILWEKLRNNQLKCLQIQKTASYKFIQSRFLLPSIKINHRN